MPGLYVSGADHPEALSALLYDFDLPLAAFTEAPSAIGSELPFAAFLRQASLAALLGQPLPGKALMKHLRAGAPLCGNVIRRHLFLRLSLMPYLRPGRAITPLEGCILLGRDLLIAPVSPEDTVDALLPPGVWTELNGVCHTDRLRCMRGWNETPVLVRENALLPISMNGQSLTQTTQDDADRLTLHWFQPHSEASCTLADGTRYQVQRTQGQVAIHADTDKPFHLILHQDGMETLVR